MLNKEEAAKETSVKLKYFSFKVMAFIYETQTVR